MRQPGRIPWLAAQAHIPRGARRRSSGGRLGPWRTNLRSFVGRGTREGAPRSSQSNSAAGKRRMPWTGVPHPTPLRAAGDLRGSPNSAAPGFAGQIAVLRRPRNEGGRVALAAGEGRVTIPPVAVRARTPRGRRATIERRKVATVAGQIAASAGPRTRQGAPRSPPVNYSRRESAASRGSPAPSVTHAAPLDDRATGGGDRRRLVAASDGRRTRACPVGEFRGIDTPPAVGHRPGAIRIEYR